MKREVIAHELLSRAIHNDVTHWIWPPGLEFDTCGVHRQFMLASLERFCRCAVPSFKHIVMQNGHLYEIGMHSRRV